MKIRPFAGLAASAAALALIGLVPGAAQDTPARPAPNAPAVLRAIVNEASGEMALQTEIALTAINRNREAEEYRTGYFESAHILAKLREYGLSDAATVDLPTAGGTTWDAEAAELWTVEPELVKIADLDEVPACLASGSATTDTTAELVYVGPGNRESFYEGRDVAGKVLLVNGPPEAARRLGVQKHGAAGLVGWSSSHPEFDRDEVGWSGLRPAPGDRATFGFVVSERRGQELRDALERGRKIVVRAVVKSQQVPDYKDQLTVALIKGTERPDEELVFTAHLYEGWAKQGANDNASGCAAVLETARVLKTLADEGRIPPLKRSVRFLFVPEISGTSAYLRLNPDIRRRMFANINLDMVGEGLIKNQSYNRLNQTPWSLPSWLNDVMAAYYEWMGDSQRDAQEDGWRSGGVLAPTGSRDPFYFLVERYSPGSDHDVFVDGSVRIPSVLMIVWPDQWYHTSGDTPDKSDPTQLKRVVTMCAAAAEFLRDRKLAGNRFAGNGQRASLSPWIATHAVVMDLTAGIFWAGSTPHQLGPFEAFDVRQGCRRLADRTLPADPALSSGEYDRYRWSRNLLAQGQGALKDGRYEDAVACADRAERLAAVRQLQTGYLYHYAFAMVIGLSMLLAWLLLKG